MKIKVFKHIGHWQVILILLVAVLALEVSCSSTNRASKGKKGMVPCPCEKNSRRR